MKKSFRLKQIRLCFCRAGTGRALPAAAGRLSAVPALQRAPLTGLICLLLAVPLITHAGLVTGKDKQGVRVRILAVDGKAASGEQISLTPGKHRLAVSCIKTESYGALSINTTLVLTVKPDCDYELLGFFEGKNAKVAVKEKIVR